MVEKPFGHDLASARRLNRDLRAVLAEDQVLSLIAMDPPAGASADALHDKQAEVFRAMPDVEETWRILQPLLDQAPPPQPYERGSWGPQKASHLVRGHDSWLPPEMTVLGIRTRSEYGRQSRVSRAANKDSRR